MVDRSVVVRLSLDASRYIAGARSAGAATTRALGEATTAADKNKKSLDTIGKTAGAIGLGAAAGVGLAVKKFADFDAQMSSVQAATKATGGEMDQLRQLAIKLGADSQFSATEAAEGIENLAKAGVSSADIMGGALKGSLDLAAAGQIDVAAAAEDTATALTQFQLSGDKATHVADLLAAGAGKAQGEVSDMAAALKYAGVPAANLGVSIEETAGTIALFAKNGIIGEQAGTSLRGMLSSLTSPSNVATKTLDSLGISVFDSQGKFIGLAGVADQLRAHMVDLTDEERANALGRIFGNEQLQAANVLYREGGAGVRTWTENVNDSGYAADTAAAKTDNLKGDIERLSGALDSLFISSGSGADGPLRGLAQGLTGTVNALNGLPDPAKNAALGLGAITAATGVTVFLGTSVITRIAETRAAISTLELSGTRGAAAMSALGRSAGIAAAGFAALAAQDILQGGGLDDTLPTVNELTNDLIDLSNAAGGGDLPKNFDDLADAIDRVGDPNKAQAVQDAIAGFIGFGGGDDVKNYRAELEALDGALSNIASTSGAGAAKQVFEDLAASKHLDADQTKALLALLPTYRDALAGAARGTSDEGSAADGTAGAIDGLTGATDTNTGSVKDNTDAVDKNIKAMQERHDQAVSAFDAETAYQRALQEGKDREKEAADIRKQIRAAEKDGAKERADLQRRASESGADTSKDMSDLQHKLADARAEVRRAKTTSARSSAQQTVAGLQSQISDKQTGSSRAARDVQEQIQASLDRQAETVAGLKARLLEYAPTLDKTTKAGQANRDVLSDMAKAWNDLSQEQQNAKGKFHEAREALMKQAEQFGATRAEAKKYADKLLQLPPRVQIRIELEKRRAQKALDDFAKAFGDLKPKTVKLFLETQARHMDSRLTEGRATGGAITGWSPNDRADNLLTPTTAGEHVWSVAEVQAAGGHGAMEQLRRLARSGQLRVGDGRADGGPVSGEARFTLAPSAPRGGSAHADLIGLVERLSARQVPWFQVDHIRHNDMAETQRWARDQQSFVSAGGVVV